MVSPSDSRLSSRADQPSDKAKKTLVDDGIVAKIIGGFTSPQAAIRRGVVLIHGRLIEESACFNKDRGTVVDLLHSR